MQTTADVTMVPPKPSTPSSDAGSPPASSTTASFKKTLDGARNKQKSSAAKVAKAQTAAQKPADSKDEVDPEETDAAAEAVAETATADETQAAVPKAQPTGKAVKQKVSTGKSASATAGQTKLSVAKPASAKSKVAQPATAKQDADDSDVTQTPQVGAQVVANAQVQPTAEPVEQDAEAGKEADEVTAKVVAQAKTPSAEAATQAPAQPAGDDNAADFDAAVAAAEDILGPSDSNAPAVHAAVPDAATMTAVVAPQTAQTAAVKVQSSAQATAPSPEVHFVDTNHPNIVTGIHGKLLPNGGTMTIRLDPPELGALQVSVHMREGVMTAAFETSSDQATRVLSHSLGQLKSALESAGVSVEKLHVQQSPRQESSDSGERQSNQRQDQEDQQQQARHEQQRRQMLNRMWRKLAGGEDPLDLVA